MFTGEKSADQHNVSISHVHCDVVIISEGTPLCFHRRLRSACHSGQDPIIFTVFLFCLFFNQGVNISGLPVSPMCVQNPYLRRLIKADLYKALHRHGLYTALFQVKCHRYSHWCIVVVHPLERLTASSAVCVLFVA